MNPHYPDRERERLSQEVYDQIFGPFNRGELHELTDPGLAGSEGRQAQVPAQPSELCHATKRPSRVRRRPAR